MIDNQTNFFMETQQAKASKFILTYGLIFGIISVLMGVVMYVTNSYLDPHWSYSVVGFLLFMVIIPLGLKAYKAENGGFLGLGEALKVGVGIALIAAIITAIWTLLLSNVLEPDYMNQMMDMQRSKMMETTPTLTQSQLDGASKMSEKFMSPIFTVAFTLVGHLFLGFLVSLVAGLVMKQKPPYEV